MGFQGWLDEISAQKERLFLWVPVAFGLGIVLYFALPREPWLYAGVTAAAAFAGISVYLHPRHHDGLRPFLSYIAAAGLFLGAAGFSCAQGATGVYGTKLLGKSTGPAVIEGYVESVENMGGRRGSRVVLSRLKIEKVAARDTPRKIRITFRKDEGIAAGQFISTLGRIDAPSPPVAPGAFDFRRSLFFEGIGGVGFAFKPATILKPHQPGGISLFFEELRNVIDKRFHEKAGTVTAGIMSALVTGERGAIAKQDDDAMRNSGLYHLLSISGSHVSIVAGVLFFFSRALMACFPWVALRYPIKKIAAAVALLGCTFYVFLAGADVPALRSLMMTGLVLAAVMLDRSPFSLRLIAFSALAVLMFAPYSLIGVSFQMSFAAVAALICFFDWIRPWWMGWQARAGFVRKTVLYIAGIVLTSLIAGTVTGVFSLYHFQSYAVYGVLSNMIAVPITGFVIMPAAIAALILMPFGLDGIAIHVMDWGTVWMLATAHWAAGLDGAVVHVVQWPKAAFAFLGGGMILFLLWSGWRGKVFACAMMACGLVLALFAPLPDILISNSGKLIAVRDADGDLYFSNGRKDKFAAQNWLRLSGRDGERPKTFRSEGAPMLCDDEGCRMNVKGMKVSYAKSVKAFREDCDWADIVVSDIVLPKKSCTSPRLTLHLFDALDHGAQAVYANGSRIRIETIEDDLGHRPWTENRIRPGKY